jgi:hypothetical protein
MELNRGVIFPEEREEQRIMAKKLILTALALGLLGGLGILAVAPAQEKPQVKTPMPIRPLPPAKPLGPVKPMPAPTETTTPVPQTQLTPPMSAAAIQRALAKKVDLDLTAVPLSEVVEAIKRQTSLEIHIASDPINLKDDDKTNSKVIDPADKPADKPDEKPADKPADKPSKSLDKPADKPAEKPADKPAEKQTEQGADNKAAEKPADKPVEKPVEKPSASDPRLSVHLKGISAASALNLVLRDVGLSWSIDHGAIVVAAPDQLPANTAIYDVRDLVVAHPAFDTRDDSVEFQYDPLISLVTGVIQCPGWAGDIDKVQDCNPFHGTLTVRQDQQVQQKVAGLLAALRKARDLPPAQYDASTDRGLAIAGADDSAVVAALNAKVDATFNGAKLDQVTEWIRHTCGIPVHVDAIVPASVVDGPIFTLKASGVSLRAVLNALLPQAKLAYTVTDETLVISTQDEVADLRSVRVYPVGDLIGGEVDQHGIDDDYAQLLDSITHNVQPDSWAALDRAKPSNATGSAYAAYLPSGRAIVFDQTSGAHEEIAATLAKLRAAVATQPVATKPLAAGANANQPEPAKRFLSMRIYKLNPDLPAEDFVAVVRDLIEPKSWSGDAYLHGVPGAIVVKQTPAIHKRIERLLIELGAIPDPKKSGDSGKPILVGRNKRV